MSAMRFRDAVQFGGVRQTTDGYLITDAKAVRTGIQNYAGHEVNRPDLPVVRVYRSEDEVRSPESLASFSHAPITIDHPAEFVTVDNWKDLAVGEVSTAATWDGSRISLPLILKDAKAVNTVKGGKRELSAGYTCDLDWTPGTTPDGKTFDAQQRNIRANHLAIVQKGRAGEECRIGDSEPHAWGASPINVNDTRKDLPMSDLRTVMHDGISIPTTDQGAQVITNLQTRLADSAAKIATLTTDHASAIAAKDKELATKDAEIADLKSKALSDADLDKRVAARADLVAAAKAIDANVVTAGLSDAAIRKAVVTTKLGDAALAGKSDAYIDAHFDILAEKVKDAKPGDKVRDTLLGGLRTIDATPVKDEQDAFAASIADLNRPVSEKAA